MSSILDALNKLEHEKAQATRESDRIDTDPMSIANELVGRSVMRDRVTLRVTPATLFASAGALAVGLVAITFAAATLLSRSERNAPAPSGGVASLPTAPSGSPTPAPAPAAAVQTAAPAGLIASTPVAEPPPADVKSSASPEPTALISVDTAKATAPPAPAPVTPASKPAEKEKDPPASLPQAAAAEPETKATQPPPQAVTAARPEAAQGEAAPTPDPVATIPPATPRPRTRIAAKSDAGDQTPARALPESSAAANRNAEVKLESLPILTPQDQMRYGFIRLKVNMVKPAGDRNPQGSAILTLEEESSGGEPIVNRMPFYEGQRLQQSPLRLFKVGTDRIGIEDLRSGEQFQLPI